MSLFTVQEQKIVIDGPCGVIEACTHAPQGAGDSAITVVICHPHPQFGGTMDNKVVTTLARLYKGLGVNALRFNFRGIGGSAGEYGGTEGAYQDLLAVVGHIRNNRPADRLLLAGFSFGSFVAFRGAKELDDIHHLVLIAPPVDRYGFADTLPNCPVCLVQGEEDDVVDPEGVFRWWAEKSAEKTPSHELIRVAAAGHFFHGKLVELKQRLTPVLTQRLSQLR